MVFTEEETTYREQKWSCQKITCTDTVNLSQNGAHETRTGITSRN